MANCGAAPVPGTAAARLRKRVFLLFQALPGAGYAGEKREGGKQ